MTTGQRNPLADVREQLHALRGRLKDQRQETANLRVEFAQDPSQAVSGGWRTASTTRPRSGPRSRRSSCRSAGCCVSSTTATATATATTATGWPSPRTPRSPRRCARSRRHRIRCGPTSKTLGDQEYGLGEKANGTFVVVDLKITNRKNETKTFMDNSAKLVTKDGNAYESSTEASMSLKDDLMLEDIQPDLTTKGSIGYDVPESKVAGAKLVIEDLWGDGEVTIKLGL